MCDAFCVLLSLLAVFSVISAFVYILLIYTIIKHRTTEEIFRSSFYTIVVSLGIADLGYLTVDWLFARIRIVGVFKSVYESLEPFPSHFVQAPLGYLYFVQQMGVLLQSWDRYICIVRPGTLTTSQRTIAAIVVQWVMPSFALFGFTPFLRCEFTDVNGTETLQATILADPPWLLDVYYTTQLGFSLITIATTSLFYLGLFRFLENYKQGLNDITNNMTTGTGNSIMYTTPISQSERRLTLCALCNFIVLLGACIVVVLVSSQREMRMSELVSAAYAIGGDALCLGNPYVLLICSKTVRGYWLFELRQLLHVGTH